MTRSNAPYVSWDSIVQPAIILVRPQLGENIGMCARAMLNCGLTDLRLVAPRDGWPNPQAIAASSGADLIIDNVKVFGTLAEAAHDQHELIGTTNRLRGMVKPVYMADAAMRHSLERIQSGVRVAVVFGPERTGLENTDLAQCGSVLSIPLNPDFNSLNLAQAVLVIAYEWAKIARFGDVDPVHYSITDSEWASAGELNYFINKLIEAIDKKDFFRSPEMKPSVSINIHTMFTRHVWTSQELRTLHGILTSLTQDDDRR